jgi:hypothetical protein
MAFWKATMPAPEDMDGQRLSFWYKEIAYSDEEEDQGGLRGLYTYAKHRSGDEHVTVRLNQVHPQEQLLM